MPVLLATATLLDPEARCLEAALHRRGISYDILRTTTRSATGKLREERWVRFERNGTVYLYRNGVLRKKVEGCASVIGEHVNGSLRDLTVNKHKMKRLLHGMGVPVPLGRLFRAGQEAEARAFFEAHGGAFCIKPNAGHGGVLVHLDLGAAESFMAAFRAVSARYERILVERMIAGTTIRVFYLRAQVVAVRSVIPANVVGDGIRTIAELAALKNRHREERGFNTRLRLDQEAAAYLGQRGADFDSVPRPGERFQLGPVANFSAGGDTVGCTGTIHPSYTALVERLCNAIPGMNICGVDLLIRHPGQPARAGNHAVLELNSSPGISVHHFPCAGEARDVASAIIDFAERDSQISSCRAPS